MFIPAAVNTSMPHEMLQTIAAVKVCNLDYLKGITRGDENSVNKLVEVFVTEINEELARLSIAIEKTNYPEISNISHKMKSAFAILGIQTLEPIVNEMEKLSITSSSIAVIKQLSQRINIVFNMARAELESAG